LTLYDKMPSNCEITKLFILYFDGPFNTFCRLINLAPTCLLTLIRVLVEDCHSLGKPDNFWQIEICSES